MATHQGKRLLGEYVWEIPDPPEDQYRHFEILDGQLFASPTPLRVHQHVRGSLLVPVSRFVEQHGLGEMILGTPAVYRVGDTFQPVLFPGLTIEVARLWP